MNKQDYTEDIVTDIEQTEEEGSLPEEVTEAPQDPEHMDLTKVSDYGKWVRAYINVSDDDGHLLGNRELEKEVKKLCNDLSEMDLYMEEDPELWINRIKDVALRYVAAINFRENTSIGTFTKYRIRMGMLFNAQKILVKEKLRKNWIVWFAENYDKSLLRSAQDYMRIAEIPNVIRYAVFGKERLLQILRQIEEPEGEDPIAAFLKEHGIEFNSYAETDYQELKIATDIAIARQKLNSEGLEEVADEKVEALVRNGIELTTLRLGQMKLVKETEGNLAAYIDRLISTGGKVEPIQTPETKAKSFKKTVDRFIDQATNALDDDQYLGEFDIELCRQLMEKIQRLEQKLTSTAS